AIHAAPPTRGVAPVYTSPGRQRPGLFFETASVRGVLRDRGSRGRARVRASRDQARAPWRVSSGRSRLSDPENGERARVVVYSAPGFVGVRLEGGFTPS